MEAWKILIVDDDPEDRSIIKEAMDAIEAGEIIEFAENGLRAIDILNRDFNADNPPCLVVLDLNMPKMNGTQTLSLLKSDARFRSIPVIIYSTSINPFEKEKCMLLGAHDYITKPISYQQSIDTAKTFLRFCPTYSTRRAQ